jgi:hypothetical protein
MSHGAQGTTHAATLDAETARLVAERMQILSTPSRVQILGRLKARVRQFGMCLTRS